MAVRVEGVTDIDGRHSQGSRLEFNAPATFVQGIKEMFSLRRRETEGLIAVDLWWYVWNRHMFFLCFVQGKTQPGSSPMDLGPCCSQSTT